MSDMVAFCGLFCDECPAYIATQVNDEAARQEAIARWRKLFNDSDIDVEFVTCDGCLITNGRLGGPCRECQIRKCALASGVANCAECEGYQDCEKLYVLIEHEV